MPLDKSLKQILPSVVQESIYRLPQLIRGKTVDVRFDLVVKLLLSALFLLLIRNNSLVITVCLRRKNSEIEPDLVLSYDPFPIGVRAAAARFPRMRKVDSDRIAAIAASLHHSLMRRLRHGLPGTHPPGLIIFISAPQRRPTRQIQQAHVVLPPIVSIFADINNPENAEIEGFRD